MPDSSQQPDLTSKIPGVVELEQMEAYLIRLRDAVKLAEFTRKVANETLEVIQTQYVKATQTQIEYLDRFISEQNEKIFSILNRQQQPPTTNTWNPTTMTLKQTMRH